MSHWKHLTEIFSWIRNKKKIFIYFCELNQNYHQEMKCTLVPMEFSSYKYSITINFLIEVCTEISKLYKSLKN